MRCFCKSKTMTMYQEAPLSPAMMDRPIGKPLNHLPGPALHKRSCFGLSISAPLLPVFNKDALALSVNIPRRYRSTLTLKCFTRLSSFAAYQSLDTTLQHSILVCRQPMMAQRNIMAPGYASHQHHYVH